MSRHLLCVLSCILSRLRGCVTIRRFLDWWPDLLHTCTTCYCTSQTTIRHTASFLLHHLRLPNQETNCLLGTRELWLTLLGWCLFYNHFARNEQKTSFPTITLFLCLPIRCLEMGSSIVACAFLAAGMCLRSCCLAVDYSGFQASCHNII
jgi:hypothetical protein